MKILFDATELSYFLEESGHRAGVFFVALNLFREFKKRKDVKLVEIQRSRGYSARASLTIDKIEKIIQSIRSVNQDVIIMVDNCYGELVE